MNLEPAATLLHLSIGNQARYEQLAEHIVREFLWRGGGRNELRDAFLKVSPGNARSDAIMKLIDTVT